MIVLGSCAVPGCKDGAECQCLHCRRYVCRQHARKVGIWSRRWGDVVFAWRCARCLVLPSDGRQP